MESMKCRVPKSVDFSPKYIAYIDVKFKKNQKWDVINVTDENITISKDGVEITMDKRDFDEVFKNGIETT